MKAEEFDRLIGYDPAKDKSGMTEDEFLRRLEGTVGMDDTSRALVNWADKQGYGGAARAVVMTPAKVVDGVRAGMVGLAGYDAQRRADAYASGSRVGKMLDVPGGSFVADMVKTMPFTAAPAAVIDAFKPEMTQQQAEAAMARHQELMRSKEIWRDIQQENLNHGMENAQSRNEQLALSAATNFGQQSLGLLGSIAAKSPAPMMANIGATVFPDAYMTGREQGFDPNRAMLYGASQAGIEAGTELIPTAKMLKFLPKGGVGSTIKRGAEWAGSELVGEQLNTLASDALDTHAFGKTDDKWAQYVRERPSAARDTAIQTVIQGGMMGATGKVAHKAFHTDPPRLPVMPHPNPSSVPSEHPSENQAPLNQTAAEGLKGALQGAMANDGFAMRQAPAAWQDASVPPRENKVGRSEKVVIGNVVNKIIGVESGGNPKARNPKSTATGYGQFIDSTWLAMVKKNRPDIAKGKSDAQIIALKTNPQLSREMTAAYVMENAAALRKAGLPVSEGNLYLAHFSGPGTAIKVLKANPNAPTSAVYGQAAIAANQSILGGKTIGQVIAWANRKMGGKAADEGMPQSEYQEEAQQEAQQDEQQETPREAQPVFGFDDYVEDAPSSAAAQHLLPEGEGQAEGEGQVSEGQAVVQQGAYVPPAPQDAAFDAPVDTAQALREGEVRARDVQGVWAQDEDARNSRSAMKDIGANIRRGHERMNRALLDKADQKRAMYRNDIGWVDFVWGATGKALPNGKTRGGMGLAHILEARMRKDGMSRDSVVKMLTQDIVATIGKGTVSDQFELNGSTSLKIDHNGYRATLAKNKGSNAWMVTAFELYEGANSKDYGKPIPTEHQSYSARTDAGASYTASDSKHTAGDANRVNDTHSHSQGGGAVVADSYSTLPTPNTEVNTQEENPKAEGGENAPPYLIKHRERVREEIVKVVGEKLAQHVEVVGKDEAQQYVGRRNLLDSTVEGFYLTGSRKIVIVADNISVDRAAWAVWHEFAHRGVAVRFADKYLALMKQAYRNGTVKKLADVIYKDRRGKDDAAAKDKAVATEEALAELFAAYKSGNFDALQQRYGVDVSGMQDMGGYLKRVANRLRAIFADVFNRPRESFSDEDVFALIGALDESVQAMAQEGEQAQGGEDFNDEAARFSIYKNTVGKMERAFESIGLETYSDSSRVSRSEYLYVKIPNRVDEFGDALEVKFRVSDHELPAHYDSANYDVLADGRSRGDASGDWQDAVRWLVNKYDLPEPAILKRLTKQKDVNERKPPRRRNPDAKEIRELKESVERYKEELKWYEDDSDEVVVSNRKHVLSILERTQKRLDELKEKAQREDLRFSRNDSSFDTTAVQYGGQEAYDRAKADGQTKLNYRQWVQVRTPEFKQWFGDWENDPANASKVVDEETGEPLVVYHGTNADFSVFESKPGGDVGFHFGSMDAAHTRLAKKPSHKASVMEVMLRAQHPFNMPDPGRWDNHFDLARALKGTPLADAWQQQYATINDLENKLIDAGELNDEQVVKQIQDKTADLFVQTLRAQGFDGVRYVNQYEGGGVSWMAFEPSQIKSATGNTGAFDAQNDDIRFSRSDGTKEKYEQRIDELFDGGKAKREGVTVLDRSDMLDMLGFGDMPVSLAEGKVIAGLNNHPLMSREVWKKIPEWIDNPAMVLDSDTEKGRLVFIAPEKVQGLPVRIILAPNGDNLVAHVLVNAYDASARMPVGRWIDDGLLRYINKESALAVLDDSGSIAASSPSQRNNSQSHQSFRSRLTERLSRNQGRKKILTEKNLQGYRKNNPFEGDAKFSRAEEAERDVVHDAATQRRSKIFPKEWTNERGELLVGVAAFEKLGELLHPALKKMRLVNSHPESFTQYMRDFRAQKNTAGLTAKDIAVQIAKFTPEQRALLSDILEKELPPDAVVSPELQEIADVMRDLFTHQSEQLVALGMLAPETAERNRDTYLPRLYQKHIGGLFDRSDLGKVNREFRQAYKKGLGQAIAGSHLKGRGIFKEVKRSEVAKYGAQGFEVRQDYGDKGDKAGKVLLWRDYTREERGEMGEVRDAGLRLTTGYVATQADIAKGILFKRISEDSELASVEEVEGWVLVPDTTIAATGGVKRYGALAGMYVHPEVAYHLQQQFYVDSVIQQNWRKALGWWKVSKTALNPVAHANNFISNISMLYVAGGNPLVLHQSAVELYKKGQYFREATEVALIGEAVDVAGLQEMFIGLNNAKSDGEMLDGLFKRFYKYTDKAMLNAPSKIGKKMMGAYQWEDEVFKMALFKLGRERGLTPTEAADWARAFIFDYSEVPQGVKWVRDSGILPFVSYTYKAIPAVARAALTRPHRFLAVTAFMYGLNALSYAMLGGGADEDEEREYMPDYQKGYTAFGTPKLIRLPFNDGKGKPMFIDVYRWFPLGDFADTQNQMGGLPIPQFLMPNGPVVNHTAALMMNKDTFTGRELVKDYMSTGEKTTIYAKWVAQQWLPSAVGVPYSYHTNNVLDGVKNELEGTKFATALEHMGYTGTNYRGEDKQLYRAGWGAVGVKLRGEKPKELKAARERRQAYEAREIKADMGRIKRDKTLSKNARDARLQRRREALDRIYEAE